jgi:hypothetical protein
MVQVVGTWRKKYQIHVSGRDVPAPLLSFEQLRTQYPALFEISWEVNLSFLGMSIIEEGT